MNYMYNLKKKKISIKEISFFLKSPYDGRDFKISSISSLNNIKNDSILFYSDVVNTKFQIKDNVNYNLKNLEKYKNVVLISSKKIKNKIKRSSMLLLLPYGGYH